MMKRLILTTPCVLTTAIASAALTFSGLTADNVVTLTPESSTGLNSVYVLRQFVGVKAVYQATSDRTVSVSRYSNLGGGFAEPIAVTKNGREYTIDLTGTSDMGYIIEEGNDRTYYWLIDFSAHPVNLQSLSISPEQYCDRTTLIPAGQGDRMTYFSINGQQVEVDREFILSYNTLEYSEDSKQYNQVETTVTLPYLQSEIYAPAPLCDTYFELSGDMFMRKWGHEAHVSSSYFNTNAVDARTWAIETEREIENEKKEESSAGAMGGSGPVEIKFGAAVSDAAVFKEWQMSYDAEFNEITTRYNDLEFTYTFTDNGTTYVRFVASNAAGDCTYEGSPYEVFVGESQLECPNAFSPGASEGINDEWRVSYKSIVNFECSIFNRWGLKIIDLNHPSQGWDGKYKGKLVPAGVYYYVIKATGTDGKQYNLGGDINVIRYKQNDATSGTTELN